MDITQGNPRPRNTFTLLLPDEKIQRNNNTISSHERVTKCLGQVQLESMQFANKLYLKSLEIGFWEPSCHLTDFGGFIFMKRAPRHLFFSFAALDLMVNWWNEVLYFHLNYIMLF